MPHLFFQKYLDQEYEDMQLSLAEISGRVVKINLSSIRSDEEFVSQIIPQAKSYAQLILELFDYIESSKSDENCNSVETRENNEKLLAILSSPGKRGKSKLNQSARDSPTSASMHDQRYLEQKIDYLNSQIVKTRKMIDLKTVEVHNVTADNTKLKEKMEFLDHTISQLKEQNQNQLNEFRVTMQKAEDENKELLDINFQLKDKYKELETELVRKRKEMIDLLDKIDPEYVDKLENEIERLKEQNEFSEKLEDLDKLKEIISEKEKQIAGLQKQLDSSSKENSHSASRKYREVIRVVNKVIREINEIMQKQDILQGRLDEISQDTSPGDGEADLLINQINSKLIDISDSLRYVGDTIPQKQRLREPSPFKESPEKLRSDVGAVDNELLLRILESAQALREQIEEGVDREILIRRSSGLFQDLLLLAQSAKHADPGINKRYGIDTQNASVLLQPSYSHNVSRSPNRLLVRGTFLRAHEEITDQLRHSVTALQFSNINELTQQLQIHIDRNAELTNKYETLQKAFHTVSLIIHEELARCFLSLDDVLSLASDNAVVLKLKRDLGEFQDQIYGLFDKQGHYYAPIVEKNTEAKVEFERQRASWETSLSRQKESFVAEIRKLEEALRREEATFKRERESSAQAIGRLEGELRFLANEKGRLGSENERLISELREEKIASEDILRKVQHDLDLERQNSYRREDQIRKLEKVIEERESVILDTTRLINELQKKNAGVEQENLILERERVTERREKELLRDQAAQVELNLKEAIRRADTAEQKVRILDADHKELEKVFSEKEFKNQIENERLAHELERAQEEYSLYIEKTEANTNELKQSYERLIDDYTRQLDQQRAAFETFRLEKESELKAKRDELRDITMKYQSAEGQTHSLELALRKKDDKINTLTTEKNSVQDKLLSFERQVRESSDAKDKSKKYFEMLTAANGELNSLKSEYQILEREKKDLMLRYESEVRETESLKEENERLRENVARNTQKINEYINESKTLKIQLESEHQNLARKEKELKYLNESTLTQTKATINFKDELIQRLKEDIKNLSTEYENLRAEYQRLIDRNQNMSSEVQSLREIAKEREGTFRGMEELDKFNDNLLQEMKRMRNELKKKDDELSVTKRQFKHELELSQRKLRDVSSRIFRDDSDASRR